MSVAAFRGQEEKKKKVKFQISVAEREEKRNFLEK